MSRISRSYGMLPTEEKSGLLNEDVQSDAGSSIRGSPCTNCLRRMHRRFTLLLIANAVLLTLLAASGILLAFRTAPRMSSSKASDVQEIADPYSPINDAIEYEYREMTIDDETFYGYPSPVWENAMKELSSDTFFRITEEELALSGTTSLLLEGGGYAAGLGVGHNLHCIQKLKMVLYPEYFYPELNRTGPVWEYALDHADHCLDFLRQSVTCHVDYSLMTIYWNPEMPDVPTHNPQGTQKCVNWNKLKGWMGARAADRSEVLRRQ